MSRPGDRILRIAERLCAPRTIERLIVPTIADVQAEYEDAIHDVRPWRRRWVWVTGHLALLRVLAAHSASSAIGILRDVTGEDRRLVLRAVAASALIIVIGTALLAAPFMVRFVPAGHPRMPALVLYLIPQALPLSIPVGLTFGILWALGRVSVSRRSRHAVLSLAFAASIASFTTLAWVMPTANQAFRVTVSGQQVPKGIRELTLGELHDRAGTGRDGHLVAIEYNKRWALGGAPLTLAAFAVALARGRRWGGLMPVVAGCLTLLGYYAMMVWTETAGRHQAIPAVVAAWAPNLTVWMSSAVLVLYRRQIGTAVDRPAS